ncbi:hypothetical protein LIPSTDRAFT_76668, partial [Lipomyces starkeyi NRRL Y-11557]
MLGNNKNNNRLLDYKYGGTQRTQPSHGSWDCCAIYTGMREKKVSMLSTNIFVDSMEFVGRLLNDLIDRPPNWQVISSSI